MINTSAFWRLKLLNTFTILKTTIAKVICAKADMFIPLPCIIDIILKLKASETKRRKKARLLRISYTPEHYLYNIIYIRICLVHVCFFITFSYVTPGPNRLNFNYMRKSPPSPWDSFIIHKHLHFCKGIDPASLHITLQLTCTFRTTSSSLWTTFQCLSMIDLSDYFIIRHLLPLKWSIQQSFSSICTYLSGIDPTYTCITTLHFSGIYQITVRTTLHRFPTHSRERSSYSSQYVHLSRVFPNSTTSWERSVYPSPLSPLSRVSSESTITPNHSAPFSRESVQISSS